MLLKIQSIFLLCFCLGYIRNIHALRKQKRTVKRTSDDGPAKKYTESEPGFDLTDAEITKFNIWPKGVIPYYIDQVSYDKVVRDRIRSYLDSANGMTGLSFSELLTPPSNDSATRWVFFINRKGQLGCKDHSMSDFTGSGVQKVILGYDCMQRAGDIAQIILALVGVIPQHNSPDRDQYVEIAEANILPDKSNLFKKVADTDWLFHDLQYDFNSAGHYSFHKHTSNGAATIKPTGSHPDGVGESDDFSESDIMKIQMLYNYISKKKDTVDECDQLFEPGKGIAVTDEPLEEEIKPRPKPNKYLGLPDNAPQPQKDDSKDAGSGDAQALSGETDNDAEKAEYGDEGQAADDDEAASEDRK